MNRTELRTDFPAIALSFAKDSEIEINKHFGLLASFRCAVNVRWIRKSAGDCIWSVKTSSWPLETKFWKDAMVVPTKRTIISLRTMTSEKVNYDSGPLTPDEPICGGSKLLEALKDVNLNSFR